MDKANDSDIVEAKFVTHLSEREIGDDIHIVKEVHHRIDGSREDKIKIIKDFKRPFWITKPIYRTYSDKRESEKISNLDRFLSTESSIARAAASKLGSRYYGVSNLNVVRESPYVYGIDVKSRTILKKLYLKRSDDFVSPFRVGALDIETNTYTDEIIVISISTETDIYLYVLQALIKDVENPEKKIRTCYEENIPDPWVLKNCKFHINIVQDELDLIRMCLYQANYANIDFLAVWNISFDILHICKRLEAYGQKPEDYFHYDKIPARYKFFKYQRGRTQDIDDNGTVTPIRPEQQWHTFRTSTNYYMIDAMSAHRYVRVGGATVPGGYSLDNILETEKVAKKLRFNNPSGLKGIDWHRYMVKEKPIEYVVYNIWDTMSMIMLDRKTKDLTTSVPLLSGASSFDIFNSGPKKIIDQIFFFYLENKRVLGTRSLKDDGDRILGLKNWIITLPSYRIENNGLKIIEEDENLITNIRGLTYDSDQVSGYPSNTVAGNVSKDTTHREVMRISGIDKDEFMMQNINSIFGASNAADYVETMHNFPSLYEIVQEALKREEVYQYLKKEYR